MGIFGAILDKLRGHGRQREQPAAPAGTATPAAPPSDPGSATTQAQAAPALENVDVGAVLSDIARQRGGGGNYQSSIVDLLKLLDLDSSLKARTELAGELGVQAGAHGSAEQNIALHEAVMRKLAENGGRLSASMRT